MSFEVFDLDPCLLRSLALLEFTHPTRIQQAVIPAALLGRDIMASAPTGTGKTAAYLLPALEHIIINARRKVRSASVVVLVPTRELALQVATQAKQLGQCGHFSIASIIGGVKHIDQEKDLAQGCDLIVATPGRLLEYLTHKAIDCHQIDILILDEADRMLDMGFSDAMWRIAQESVNCRQKILISATLEGQNVIDFSQQILQDPAFFDIEPSKLESKKINQWVHLTDHVAHKRQLLVALLKQEALKKTIVFVKKRESLAALSAYLDGQSIGHVTLRGEIAQSKRLQALTRFRENQVQVLIATDVAARGIDLPMISHVINYDLPYSADVYVHRIGRTARAGQCGTAISLVEAHEMLTLAKIERYTQQRLKRRVIPGVEPKHKEAKIPTKKKKVKKSKEIVFMKKAKKVKY